MPRTKPQQLEYLRDGRALPHHFKSMARSCRVAAERTEAAQPAGIHERHVGQVDAEIATEPSGGRLQSRSSGNIELTDESDNPTQLAVNVKPRGRWIVVHIRAPSATQTPGGERVLGDHEVRDP